MTRSLPPLACLVFSASFIIAGCGGSSYSRTNVGGVLLCAPATEYNPLPKDLPTDNTRSKASWPGSNAVDAPLEPGTYEYVDMDFYFEDTSTGFQYHVGEERLESPKGEENDQNYEVRRICARNTNAIGNLNVSINFPSTVTIGVSGKVTSSTRTLRVVYENQLKVTGDPGDTLELPPSKVTGDQNYVSQLYVSKARDGKITFEDRMEDVSGPIKKWALIRYRKVQSPP